MRTLTTRSDSYIHKYGANAFSKCGVSHDGGYSILSWKKLKKKYPLEKFCPMCFKEQLTTTE
ncbi:MAG: hypothetical protein KAS32_30195 [Candidatus Peribacteraceae bacterium]|nr:hypothetical protein [Candidatus Peribacteraceae bacterium]